jgi:phosphate transport system substrate-binding protein
VKGNGSNAGIIDFLDKKIDIVDSTRAMTPDELALAQTRGMHVQEFVAAQDGLAIIVNPKNPLPSLSFDQLAEIYSSTSTTWRQFGGSNDVIHVYGRKGNSGTNSFFRHLVLNDVPYSPNMIQATDTQSIIQAVASDVSSIGYVGSGLLFDMTGNVRPDIKVVMISKDGRTYYSPLDVNAVQSRKYPLARSMYQYISSVPVRGSAIDGLLRFEMSTAGQDVIRKSDFFLNATDTIQSNQKIIDMIQ